MIAPPRDSYHYHRDVSRMRKAGTSSRINLTTLHQEDVDPMTSLKIAIVVQMIADARAYKRLAGKPATPQRRSLLASGHLDELADGLKPARVREVLDYWDIDVDYRAVVKLANVSCAT